MNQPIAVIIGTNRPNSLSHQIGEYYVRLLASLGQDAFLMPLTDLPTDFAFSALYQNSGKSEGFNAFQKKIDAVQKMVFVIPEYNGSFPGVLKTFLDGLRYPDSLREKKAALVGVSAGVLGNAVGLGHFNDILSYAGCNVLGLRAKLGLANKHFINGAFELPIYEEFLDKQAKQLIAF